MNIQKYGGQDNFINIELRYIHVLVLDMDH